MEEEQKHQSINDDDYRSTLVRAQITKSTIKSFHLKVQYLQNLQITVFCEDPQKYEGCYACSGNRS